MSTGAKRWLRRLALGFGALLVLLLLTVAGAFVWVSNPPGEDFVRRKVLEVLATSLPGKVAVDTLSLDGTTVKLKGVSVATPDGARVLAADELTATIALRSLLSGTIRLTRLDLDGLTVVLRRDDEGLTLTRAFVKEGPKEKKPDDTGGGLKLELSALEVKRGTITYEDPERREVVSGLGGTGALALVTAPFTLDLKAALAGQLDGEPSLPLKTEVALTTPKTDEMQLALDLRLGAALVEGLKLNLNTFAAELKKAELPPEVARRLLPTWPLKVAVKASAGLTPHAANLQVEAGAARITAKASGAPLRADLEQLELSVADLDLSELLGSGEPSKVAAQLTGSWSGTTLTEAKGNAELKATWSAPTGPPLVTADLSAAVSDGVGRVGRGNVTAPGVEVTLAGVMSPSSLDAQGTLVARDLSKLERLIQKFAPSAKLQLAGSGRIAFTARGQPASPTLTAKGHLDGLRVATLSALRLELDLDVPNTRRPWESDGTIKAQRLAVGGITLDALGVAVHTERRRLDVRLDTKGLGDTKLRLVGIVDANGEGAALELIELSDAQNQWHLEAPTHVRWAEERIRLDPMALVSGPQRVGVELKLDQGKTIEARVGITSFDLAKLPRIAVPEGVKLAGLLSGNAQMTGSLKKPKVAANLELSRGAAFGIEGVSVKVAAEVGKSAPGLASGHLEVESGIAGVNADFQVPIVALGGVGNGPVAASLKVSNLTLSEVRRAFGQPMGFDGVIDVAVDVTGTLQQPDAKVAVASSRLEVGGACMTVYEAERFERTAPCALGPGVEGKRPVITIEQPRVEVFGAPDGALAASAQTRVFGGDIAASLTTSLRLAQLLSKPPTAEQLKELPLEATVKVQGLPLDKVQPWAPDAMRPLAGTLGVEASFKGSMVAPELKAFVNLKQAQVAQLKALDATLTASTGVTETRLGLRSSLATQPFVRLDAVLPGDGRTLVDLKSWGPRAVNLWLAVDSTSLQSLGFSEKFKGTLGLNARLNGRFEAPTLEVALTGERLLMHSVQVGSASLVASTKAGQGLDAVVKVIQAPGSQEALIEGSAGVDLRWASLMTPDFAAAPLDFKVKVHDLDLGFLSRVHPMLIRVGGKLTADGAVKGSVGAPDPSGRVIWNDGVVALAGMGEYRNIYLDAVANNQEVSLTRLELKAGGGSASLSAFAQRKSATSWSVDARGQVDHLPIITNDQLMAVVTLDPFSINGAVGDNLVDVRQLALSKVLVELPDLMSKELQSLETPGDVVVLRNGKRPQAPKRQEGPKQEPMHFRLVVDAPRNVWVKSKSDVNIELGLSERFTVEYADTVSIQGDVYVGGRRSGGGGGVSKGTLNLLGRRFEVSNESVVRFSGPPSTPNVELKAIYANEREQVKVTAVVSRRGTTTSIKLSSEPPLTDEEIYTLLATGRRDLKRGGGASITPQQAASVVGSVGLGLLKSGPLQDLPIDVLSIDQGEQGFASLNVRVGKYLGDNFYIGYRGQPGANPYRGENPHEVQLEWQLAKLLGLELTAGTAAAGSLDLVFSRDY